MSDFSFAPAEYVSTGMPQYDGNPLIECLPKILSDVDVVRRIGNTLRGLMRRKGRWTRNFVAMGLTG